VILLHITVPGIFKILFLTFLLSFSFDQEASLIKIFEALKNVFNHISKQFQHRDKLTPLHANYYFSNMVFHALYNSRKYNHWASNHGIWELEEVI